MRIAWPLLIVAALLTGCQSMTSAPSERDPAARLTPWGRSPKAEKPKSSLWGSWFTAEEPPPPKTMKEWMDLEPIRP